MEASVEASGEPAVDDLLGPAEVFLGVLVDLLVTLGPLSVVFGTVAALADLIHVFGAPVGLDRTRTEHVQTDPVVAVLGRNQPRKPDNAASGRRVGDLADTVQTVNRRQSERSTTHRPQPSPGGQKEQLQIEVDSPNRFEVSPFEIGQSDLGWCRWSVRRHEFTLVTSERGGMSKNSLRWVRINWQVH